MLRIKLSRRGKKKQPVYRILVIEKQKDPWGDFIENVGTYNPRLAENTTTLKEDRVKHWLSVGAQPTPTVHNLLVDAGIITEKKVRGSNLGSAFKKKVKEEAEKAKEEAAAAKEAEEAAKAEAEAPKESDSAEATPDKEAPAKEEKTEEKKEDSAPAEEKPAEEKKEEAPAKDEPKEEKKAE